jgi:Rap1a immunity proteins
VRIVIICGALTMSVMTAGAAEIDTESANYVLPGCKALLAITEGRAVLDTSSALGAGYCMGVLKTLPEIYFWRDKCSIQFPGIFSVQQMTLIVVRYIEAHPERMNIPFLILAEDALRDAWPCRN